MWRPFACCRFATPRGLAGCGPESAGCSPLIRLVISVARSCMFAVLAFHALLLPACLAQWSLGCGTASPLNNLLRLWSLSGVLLAFAIISIQSFLESCGAWSPSLFRLVLCLARASLCFRSSSLAVSRLVLSLPDRLRRCLGHPCPATWDFQSRLSLQFA